MRPGWWRNAVQLLRQPLLPPAEPALPDARVAGWLDAHTMAVHGALLASLAQGHALRRDRATGELVLEGAYGEQLRRLQVEEQQQQRPCGGGGGGGDPATLVAEETGQPPSVSLQ